MGLQQQSPLRTYWSAPTVVNILYCNTPVVGSPQSQKVILVTRVNDDSPVVDLLQFLLQFATAVYVLPCICCSTLSVVRLL